MSTSKKVFVLFFDRKAFELFYAFKQIWGPSPPRFPSWKTTSGFPHFRIFRISGFPVFSYFRFFVLPVSSVLPVLDARPDPETSEIPHSDGKGIP